MPPLVNQTAPTISGTPAVGSQLTANPGTWTPSGASFAYKWYANGLPIAGATQQTFTPTTVGGRTVYDLTQPRA